MNLTDILKEAEQHYEAGEYPDAVRKYIESQQLLLEDYKRLNTFIQERLREIVVKLSDALSFGTEPLSEVGSQEMSLSSEPIEKEERVVSAPEERQERVAPEITHGQGVAPPEQEPSQSSEKPVTPEESVSSAASEISELEAQKGPAASAAAGAASEGIIAPDETKQSESAASESVTTAAEQSAPSEPPAEEVKIDDIMKQLDELDKEVAGAAGVNEAAELPESEEDVVTAAEKDREKSAKMVENVDIDELLKDLNI